MQYNKTSLKPGIFSCHSIVARPHMESNNSFNTRTNTTQDTTIHRSHQQMTVNPLALQMLQQQFQQVIKQQTPSKSKSVKSKERTPILQGSIDPKKIIKKAPKTSDKKNTPQTKMSQPQSNKSGKKLNFNTLNCQQRSDSDAFLKDCNNIGNIIIENILNKDDVYDKIKQENLELVDQKQQLLKQIRDYKKQAYDNDQQLKSLHDKLEQERNKYHNELLKFQEKLSVVKSLQTNLSNEKTKSDNLMKQLKTQGSSLDDCRDLLSNIALSSVEYLSYFQGTVERLYSAAQGESLTVQVVNLLKYSLQLVFEVIEKTQQLQLPALQGCQIEDFDFEGFFRMLEHSEQPSAKRKSDTIPNDSLQDSIDASQELSFRQKPAPSQQSNYQVSLPLSQVYIHQNSQPSKNISLQEQFNEFLDAKEQAAPNQMGSPYFTQNNMPLQQPQQRDIPCKDMPLQVRKKPQDNNNAQMLILQPNNNRFQTDFSESGRTSEMPSERVAKQVEEKNFHSFNKNTKKVDHLSVVQHRDDSQQDATLYDSLVTEMIKSESQQRPKKNSLHTLRYFDQQINKSQEPEKQKVKQQVARSTDHFSRADKENLDTIQTSISSGSVHCNNLAIAIHNFKAVKSDNLSFQKGDRIIIYKMNRNGWWLGMCNGKQGYFPHNYVLLQQSEQC